ncbi:MULTISPECIES: nuclear transport factor 2 family protein [Streptomyces]|uniref:Nuclear transport factor 2 family protein n=1 Tax=Streptomyces rhizosphaericus TaxID=114699 RepID=A0A6G4AHK2_9ACTN|nr:MULTISPECIES: nuclear transport factor 2 family protein [Streptomyces]NEW72718.1 nuclear transport factor 2 family protein [Streptomyces rhizosphaericus]
MTRNRIEKINEFLRILEKYDFSSAQARCTEKAVVWQNDSTVEQPMAERMEQFGTFVTNLKSLRYEVQRQFENPDEVLQQHILHLHLNDGSHQQVHALVYFRFEGDLIDRIEEYHYSMPTD